MNILRKLVSTKNCSLLQSKNVKISKETFLNFCPSAVCNGLKCQFYSNQMNFVDFLAIFAKKSDFETDNINYFYLIVAFFGKKIAIKSKKSFNLNKIDALKFSGIFYFQNNIFF